MHCVQCGTALSQDSKFCASCGNQIEAAAAPSSTQSGALSKFMANLVDGEVGQRISFLDRIDQSKLNGAKKKYLTLEPGDETPLVLFDDTVMGGGKEGFAITNQRFVSNIRDKWGGNFRELKLPLDKIQSFRIEKAKMGSHNVLVNDKLAGNVTQIGDSDIERASMLLSLVISHPQEFVGASAFPPGGEAQNVAAANIGVAPAAGSSESGSSKGTNWGATLGGLAMAAAVGLWIMGSGGSISTTSGASQIIKQNLKSPSSFREVDSRVLWSGKDKDGNDAHIVRVEYEAQNGFGAMLRNCKIVSYYKEGDNLRWSTKYGFESCDLAFMTEEQVVDLYKKTNFGT